MRSHDNLSVPTWNYRSSVVVVTYGREEILVSTLRNILENTTDKDQIIVVDQTPNHLPTTGKFLEQTSTSISRFTVVKQTPGIGRARNRGIAVSSSEFVIFVDDDVTVPENFIEKHLEYFQQKQVSAVAGHSESPCGRPYFEAEGETSNRIVGCNMSFRRAVLIQVGGFDDNLISTREDHDITSKLLSRGHLIANGKECKLIHHAELTGGCSNRALTCKSVYNICHDTCYIHFKERRHFIAAFTMPLHLISLFRWRFSLRSITRSRLLFASLLKGHYDGYQSYLGRDCERE